MEKICVAVRVRPSISQENSSGTFWRVEDNRISLHKLQDTTISSLSYAFGNFQSSPFFFFPILNPILISWNFVKLFLDHVFDESCSNSKVYELLAKDIIHAAVDGFNGLIFSPNFFDDLDKEDLINLSNIYNF